MGRLDLGYAERSFQGIAPCGDGVITAQRRAVTRVMLADGIGHGAHAHAVVQQLQQQFRWICGRSADWISIADCLLELHRLLRESRRDLQAAVAMLDVDADTWKVSALCVGNVKAHQVSATAVLSVPCLNGMVGGQMPQRLPLFQQNWPAETLLTLHSDGVSTRGLLPYLQTLLWSGSQRHLQAQPIADTVLGRFGKTNDDASCVVLVHQQEGA